MSNGEENQIKARIGVVFMVASAAFMWGWQVAVFVFGVSLFAAAFSHRIRL